jgi:hypothetical protein
LSCASLSFSGVSSAMNLFCEQGIVERAPSAETCILWDLKFGFYKLNRPKKAADDWIWIADHFVSKGPHKCFVVLGVRLSALQDKNNLTISCKDVEPIIISPMHKSNGELVKVELERALQSCGGVPPLEIVSDHGSDILRGVNLFCHEHPTTVDIYDIPHKIARMYDHRLRDDNAWNTFTKKCTSLKNHVLLTECSSIAPPNQRTKARYQNIDVLIDWIATLHKNFERYSECEQHKLAWLKKYEKNINYWSQLVQLGRDCRKLIREEGIWHGCHAKFKTQLLRLNLCPLAETFADELIRFLQEEERKIPDAKRFIGSSEIIESLFGRYKNISENGPKKMGGLILSMASRVGDLPTEELVSEAFSQSKTTDVFNWIEKAFA